MTSLIDAVLEAQRTGMKEDPEFPHAPLGWNRKTAEATAEKEKLALSAEHWDVVRALHEYYSRHQDQPINMRELHDALDEKFHEQGGIRHLYQILPGGPIAQGCRLAGLSPPVGAINKSFGSVS